MEKESNLEKNGAHLNKGIVYLRFINDSGQVRDLVDGNFSADINEAIYSLNSYIDMRYFFLEKDMKRGRIPNLRIFKFNGIEYKITNISMQSSLESGFRGTSGEAKQIDDSRSEFGFTLRGAQIDSVYPLPPSGF